MSIEECKRKNWCTTHFKFRKIIFLNFILPPKNVFFLFHNLHEELIFYTFDSSELEKNVIPYFGFKNEYKKNFKKEKKTKIVTDGKLKHQFFLLDV